MLYVGLEIIKVKAIHSQWQVMDQIFWSDISFTLTEMYLKDTSLALCFSVRIHHRYRHGTINKSPTIIWPRLSGYD